jgi:ATP-binding cassette subfamily C protein
LKLAKAHGRQAGMARAFEAISRTMGRRQVRVARNQALAGAGFELGSAVALCGFVWFAVALQEVRGAELGVLAVVFMRLASRLMALQKLGQRLELLGPAYAATERLRREWEGTAEGQGEGEPARMKLATELALRGVSYRYPGTDRAVLSGVDLVLPAGKTVAICGPSGAGKSTLADLCLGLLSPEAGTVTVDGEAMAGARLAGWRASVAYVPQEVFLFNDTLRHNLAFLAPGADEAAMWAALRMAAADEMAAALPQGLDTMLGDRGVRLSGGERQRIALARALLREPTLLVLDEATSALDHGNERLVQEAIERLRGRMTIVLIAHRLSTLRYADRVVVLEAGRIVQAGEWEALRAEAGGAFARMAEAAEL